MFESYSDAVVLFRDDIHSHHRLHRGTSIDYHRVDHCHHLQRAKVQEAKGHVIRCRVPVI